MEWKEPKNNFERRVLRNIVKTFVEGVDAPKTFHILQFLRSDVSGQGGLDDQNVSSCFLAPPQAS